MNTRVSNPNRVNIVLILILVSLACFGVGASMVLFDNLPQLISWLNGLLAIFSFAFAIILPIRQKHFSFYSVVLAVCGILFLVSGVIAYQYNAIVEPLSVVEQMEFSKFMRPMQVSRGLSNMGMGLSYLLVSFSQFHAGKSMQKSKSQTQRILTWVFAVGGILFLALGIMSVVEGLGKL